MDKFIIKSKKRSFEATLTTEGEQNFDSQQALNETIIKEPEVKKSCPNEKENFTNCPYQPINILGMLETQQLKGRTLKFQTSWFKDFKWLHVDNNISGVLCYFCQIFFKQNKEKLLAKKMEETFVSTGFRNWKKALEKFKTHEKSDAHMQAVLHFRQLKYPIDHQLNDSVRKEQENSRLCLKKIIGSIRYLARQGLAFRGHCNEEGNLKQLLKERSEDVPILKTWLNKERDVMTHSSIQNEIIEIMAKQITRKICKDIVSEKPPIFSIICDGTRDISGHEQLSICIRWVDEKLIPQESFVGLYDTNSTTGEAIASIIEDTMIRLQMPFEHLRGQTYDGASNMSGVKAGVQAILKQKQPLAKFVHCGPHCLNLIMKDACEASPTARNSLQWAHELGILFSQSLKAKRAFNSLSENHCGNSVGKIKPLCPTRWIYRRAQVEELIQKLPEVLLTLEELSEDRDNSISSKSNGLHTLFQSGTTILGFFLVRNIITQIEILNKSFQSRRMTVTNMMNIVDCALQLFKELRSEEAFDKLFREANEFVATNELEEIKFPRRKKTPKRFGPSEDFQSTDVKQYYRREYFLIVDTVITGLHSKFEKEDLKQVQEMESVLLKTEINANARAILSAYPELDVETMKAELKIFRKKEEKITFTAFEVAESLRKMPEEVRSLFSNLEILLRILTVLPSSSCEAERSFSALRRLKTYLRNTMTQKRLNHLIMCHVHQDLLDDLLVETISTEFISVNERREKIFGKS